MRTFIATGCPIANKTCVPDRTPCPDHILEFIISSIQVFYIKECIVLKYSLALSRTSNIQVFHITFLNL